MMLTKGQGVNFLCIAHLNIEVVVFHLASHILTELEYVWLKMVLPVCFSAHGFQLLLAV